MRGAVAKQEITKKIFEVFPNAFLADKIIRIPIEEDGEIVEIKLSMVAAKDVLGGTSQIAPPTSNNEAPQKDWRLTQDEKDLVVDIMKRQGISERTV